MQAIKSPSEFIYQQREDTSPRHAGPLVSGASTDGKSKLSYWEVQGVLTSLATEQGIRVQGHDGFLQRGPDNTTQAQFLRKDTPDWVASALSPVTIHPAQQLSAECRSTLQCAWQSPPYIPSPLSHHLPSHRPETNMDYQMDCDGPPSVQQPATFTAGARHSPVASAASHGSRDSNQIPQVYIAIGRIHEICLRATSIYLSALDANRRARESCPALPTTPSTLLNDNNDGNNRNTSSHTGSPCHRQQQNDNTARQIPQPSSSLLKNISIICNQLWMGSQRDRLDVLNVEREAAKTMALLLEWAETVVLGDYDEWALAGEDAFWNVVHAGRHLCNWLGVQESIDAMNELETQLASEVDVIRGGEGAST